MTQNFHMLEKITKEPTVSEHTSAHILNVPLFELKIRLSLLKFSRISWSRCT